MNASVKDKTSKDKNILKTRPARLAKDGFHTCLTGLAGVEHCYHESLAHLSPDASATIFKCVFERFPCFSDSAKSTARRNIKLTVVTIDIFVVRQIFFFMILMLSENRVRER